MGFLRTLLSIAVVLDHSSPIFGWDIIPGNIAVEAFFILSGFYMALILNEKYITKESNLLFLSNRFLRLFPVYWVILIITIIASAVSYALVKNSLFFEAYLTTPLSWLAYIFLGSINIAMFGQDATVFLEVQKTTGAFLFTSNFRDVPLAASRFLIVPQAWSLSLELMFYLIAPYLLRRSWKSILAVTVASLVIRAVILYGIGWDHDPWNRRFFPSELAFFLMGALAYKIHIYLKTNSQFMRYARLLSVFILLLTAFYQWLPKFDLKEYAYYLVLFACLPFLFDVTKSFRLDRMLGEYSYPLYLVHILVVRLINTFTTISNSSLGIAAVALSFVLSFALLKWVSEPIERFRETRARKAQAVI